MVQVVWVDNKQFATDNRLLRVSILVPQIFTVFGPGEVCLELPQAGVIRDVFSLSRVVYLLPLQDVLNVGVSQDLQIVFLRLATVEVKFSVHEHEPRVFLQLRYVINVISHSDFRAIQINQIEQL
jgi:hypothetical protein